MKQTIVQLEKDLSKFKALATLTKCLREELEKDKARIYKYHIDIENNRLLRYGTQRNYIRDYDPALERFGTVEDLMKGKKIKVMG